MSTTKHNPQAARIRRLQYRAQRCRDDLRGAIAAMEIADRVDAPESVRVPIRKMIADARQGLEQARLELKAAKPVDDQRVWEVRVRQQAADRLKAKIAAIRKGGYTKGTQARLIEKARAWEESHLHTTFALKAAAQAKRNG